MKLIAVFLTTALFTTALGTGLRRDLRRKENQQQKRNHQSNRNGRGKHQWGMKKKRDNILVNMPTLSLSQSEIDDLKYMREEEKMARDIYQEFYSQYGTRIFRNIGSSEQHHMDMVKDMLDATDTEDPALGRSPGSFYDSSIQDMYDELVETGSKNLTAALQVGGLIEEVDISDLIDAMEDTENASLDSLYGRLKEASENHLRAFARVLDNLSETYQAQFMNRYDCNAIIGREN